MISYKFTVKSLSGTPLVDVPVNPLYKDLSIDDEHESGQQLFRRKLSGRLVFIGKDFDLFNSADFETEFILTITDNISRASVIDVQFMKTDGKWDLDNKRVEFKMDTADRYSEIMDGLEKEYNLVKLAPIIQPVQMKKRPMIQIYTLGSKSISCLIGGSYWEQDANEVSDENVLTGTFGFAKVPLSGYGSVMIVEDLGEFLRGIDGVYTRNSDAYTMREIPYLGTPNLSQFALFDSDGNQRDVASDTFPPSNPPANLIFYTHRVQKPELKATIENKLTQIGFIYGRILLNKNTFSGRPTMAFPNEDISGNASNYTRVFPYDLGFGSRISGTNRTSLEPTSYGRVANKDSYYEKPFEADDFYPVCRNSWSIYSIWYHAQNGDVAIDEEGSTPYTLKDTYPFYSVLDVLLKQIDPRITFKGTPEYSEFLYGDVEFRSGEAKGIRLFLAQKSNALIGIYDQAAQKAPITLKLIFDMLKDVLKCYWFIDENNRLRIEHIRWFMYGGSYLNNLPEQIGLDITTLINPKNNLPWAYSTNNVDFDKINMPSKYTFTWMDKVSPAFEGMPIEITSRYVERSKVESINASNITTDIDFITSNPSLVSKDGFVLLGTTSSSQGVYDITFRNAYLKDITSKKGQQKETGLNISMQNGDLSWTSIAGRIYPYDAPAKDVIINGDLFHVEVARSKKQTVSIPTILPIDNFKLVKTNVGNGQIEKISLNLSSRITKITLKHNNE